MLVKRRPLTIEELEEIPVERNTKEDLQCIPAMHTMYRSLLGQINWLQKGHSFNVATSSLDVLQWQLLQSWLKPIWLKVFSRVSFALASVWSADFFVPCVLRGLGRLVLLC